MSDEEYDTSLASAFKEMFIESKNPIMHGLCDVIIETLDIDRTTIREIYVPKVILTVRSDVFRKILLETPYYRDGNKTNRINLVFTSCIDGNEFLMYPTMKHLVHSLLCDELKFSDEHDNCHAPVRDITKLFNAAHYFGVKHLMKEINEFVEACDIYNFHIKDAIYVAYSVADRMGKGSALFKEAQGMINWAFQPSSLAERITWADRSDNCQSSDIHLSLEMLLEIPINKIALVFNNDTVKNCDKDDEICKVWLPFLSQWSDHSSIHAKAAQKALLQIDPEHIDVKAVKKMYHDKADGVPNTLITEKIASHFNALK